MDQTRLRELEDQCIQDCAPPCMARCPVHVDVRALTAAIAAGDLQSAARVFMRAVPFPEIIARTCDQPCQSDCYRNTRGGAIQVAALELTCLQGTSVSKPTLLPQKDARVAVIGSGLAAMTTALELRKKGYLVSVHSTDKRLGEELYIFHDTQLPREVILCETGLLQEIGVEIHLADSYDPSRLMTEYDAVFIGEDPQDQALFSVNAGQMDPLTYQTAQSKLFASPRQEGTRSSILSVSQGKRAAISLDRFLQKVSLTASRLNEGAYENRLVTNITKVEEKPLLPPPDVGWYTSADAAVEAGRCLQCDCMECVKVCEYLKHYGSYPRKYVREIYNNLSIIMRTRTANKMINSCTLCGLCAEVCPTDLDMGTVNYEVRQTMVKTAKMPVSAHDFALRDMAFSNSSRAALTLCADEKTTCSDLFFPGCQLSASNPEYIPLLYQSLASVLPDLGLMLRCCGAPADWSGEQELFAQTMSEFRQKWLELGKPRLVLACSSCLRMFKTHLPEAQTVSVWEVFGKNNLYPAGRAYSRPLAVHDPCTSRYEEDWQNEVRSGLEAMGVGFHELEMSRKLTECCGYGGVAWLAHPELVKDILKRRASEDKADYLTYCVMCRDLLASEGKPTLHLLDLLYGKDLEHLAVRRGPDYSQRHENRLRAKQKMMKLLSGKETYMSESHERYTLAFDPETRAFLEDRMILVEDVQKVIEHAESGSEYFINQENGHRLAFYKPNLITYWVEYTPEGQLFHVYDAYSHRMELEGGKTA